MKYLNLHCETMYNQYPSTFYVHVKVDIPNELMKHVIGTKGKWFKYTANKCGVSNIWYNQKRNLVEIWGPIENLMTAFYAIQNRIKIIKDRFDIIKSEDATNVFTWPTDDYFELSLTELVERNGYSNSDVIVKQLIGITGHNFKKITRDSGVSFIWYNHQNDVIQIWGLSEDIKIAVEMLFNKYQKVISKNNSNTITNQSSSANIVC